MKKLVTYDENEHCKSVFAHAGGALYQAQVLESAIQNLLVVGGIVSGDVASHTEFDQLEATLRQYTLGRLLREFRKDATLNGKAEEIIDRALDRRNFVAHHFFKERAVEFIGRKGREAMIDELVAYENLFIQAEALISAIGGAMATHLGVTDEKVQAEFDRLARQAR